MNWQSVLPGVWMFRDSCNVYAVVGPVGVVIIDAGTGRWVSHLSELPIPTATAGPAVTLLCTHYFRDHSDGARVAANAGIPVFVPQGERAFFEDPVHHFNSKQTYVVYDNHWVHFAPIEPIPIAGVLLDYDRPTFGGLRFEVIPLPGVTITQIGLGVQLRHHGGSDRKIVFSAETIHSPGKVPRIAPLQYNYNDLLGAINVVTSARWLRERSPDALFPSLGEPILADVDAALASLQDNVRALRPDYKAHFDKLGEDPLAKVTEHVWKSTHGVANSWYLISESGKALVIDYGYDMTNVSYPSFSQPTNRRTVLHALAGLKSRFGIDRIDVALISHFHDDHVCGVPLLQRLFNTQCWAAEHFAELLANPAGHAFPCNWHQPTRIDRRLPLDQPFQWEEFTFHLHPMNGHTRFSALIGFEADGRRFAHTGDQYFFMKGGWDGGPMTPFAQNQRLHNHVYRNGALLDGYDISGKWMLEWRPDIVLQGHQPPFITDEAFFDHIKAWAPEYRQTHQNAMVLSEDAAHFNLDSWGGWIWPYHTHLPDRAPGSFSVKVTVRNPLPREALLHVRLIGPTGWVGESRTLTAGARAEVSTELSITPTGPCRRQPFAVDLTADGHVFGQVAEALVTVGHPVF